MNDPDYSSYTLAELRDAHRHIDRDAYPERFTVLEQELQTREAAEPVRSPNQDPETGLSFQDIAIARSTLHGIHILTLLVVINQLAQAVLGESVPLLIFRVSLDPLSGPAALGLLSSVATWIVFVLLALGCLAIKSRRRIFRVVQTVGWGLLSIQVLLPAVSWWPMALGNFTVGIETSDAEGLDFALRLSLAPAMASLWTGLDLYYQGKFTEPEDSQEPQPDELHA